MIVSGNIRVKKIYAGGSAVSRVYVGMSKIFPDIVLTTVPETHTFAYQMNQSVVFVVSTAAFVVTSKPDWITTTVSGVNMTAKTSSEHNTSNTARSGSIVIASSEDDSVQLTIPVRQSGNVYIISTTTEETWSSGWHCEGCDDVRDYDWRYKYTWTDGSVTYSGEYSDEDRDTNWKSCVEAVGSTCRESTGSWSGWGAKVYGSPYSSCSGLTEVVTTPWTQQRSRTITTTCTWDCTGATAPGGGSRTEWDEQTGEDVQYIANTARCEAECGKSCNDSIGAWGEWGAKMYGSPQSSCSGSTEVIVTPWTQQRSRTITTTCTWNCTGGVAPGGSSRTETGEQSGSDTRNVPNSSNCGPTVLYTETCHAFIFMGCEGKDWKTARYKDEVTITTYYSNGTNNSSSSSSSWIVDSDCMCFPNVEQCQESHYEDYCTRN